MLVDLEDEAPEAELVETGRLVTEAEATAGTEAETGAPAAEPFATMPWMVELKVPVAPLRLNFAEKAMSPAESDESALIK